MTNFEPVRGGLNPISGKVSKPGAYSERTFNRPAIADFQSTTVLQDLTQLTSTRGGQPKDAPAPRALPAGNRFDWSRPAPDYVPVTYVGAKTAGRIAKNLPGYAADADPDASYDSWTGVDITKDVGGRPQNPTGRTGYAGLGSCSFYGPNFAADPIVTRDTEHGPEVLLIKRGDTGEWAIPGGKIDAGEEPWQAAERELSEESGVDVDFSEAVEVYRGYVDDPRNTDNAWFETSALHAHLTGDAANQVPKGTDDAVDAMWAPLNDATIAGAYSDHGRYLQAALKSLAS